MNPVISVTKHAILRAFSVFCVIAVLALIGLGIKRILYPRASESYAQKAEQIQNYEYNYDYSDKDIMFLGLKLWKIRLGVSLK